MSQEDVAVRLKNSAKYRDIHPDTIDDVVTQAAAVGGPDLEHRARLVLHKVAAGYLVTNQLRRLTKIQPAKIQQNGENPADERESHRSGSQVRQWCREVLGAHFSSAERLPDLDRFYPTIFDAVGPTHEVADLACALGPFTVPWLRDVTDATYVGYDLNKMFVDLGASFLDGRYPRCTTVHADILVTPQVVTADVALLLKTYHNIEDRQAGTGRRLVAALASPTVVVSLPVRTMNGRPAHFTPRLAADLGAFGETRGWTLQTRELPTELILIIHKGPIHGSPA